MNMFFSYIKIKQLFRNTYLYIDILYKDKNYGIDYLAIPENIRKKLKFKFEFIKDNLKPFLICSVSVPKMFSKSFENLLDDLDVKLNILNESGYQKTLLEFNRLFSEDSIEI